MAKKISKTVVDECGGDCTLCLRFNKKVSEACGCLVLTKRKISTKYVPPDSSLLRALSQDEKEKTKLTEISDEELEKLFVELKNKVLIM